MVHPCSPDEGRPAPARRRGFTVIELLCIVTIVAILASLAITKFGNTKRWAYLTAMKTDLRNVASVAESAFRARGTYTGVAVPEGSEGVILTFEGSTSRWTATATHPRVPDVVCTLGNAPGEPREPECR